MFDSVCLVNNFQINNKHDQISIPNSSTTVRLPCADITAALMPGMNANTPDVFSTVAPFRETKPGRYKVRLPLWQ